MNRDMTPGAPTSAETTVPELSAIAIARNEERNLPGLIENLRGHVRELILVDDNSTDRTREIAEAAAPFVVYCPRAMDPEAGFAGQRNHGLAQAQGTWVIHMDCDERLSVELARDLAAHLPQSQLNAYRYRRLNYFLNRPMRHGGWETWNRPQICRRTAHRVVGRLHEACEIDGGTAMTGQMTGLMHHLNDFDFRQRLEKSAQYTLMEADRLEASNIRVRPVHLIAKPLFEFAKKYVIKRGALDGVPGLIAALHSATAIFRSHALVWDRQNAVDRSKLEANLSGGDREGQGTP